MIMCNSSSYWYMNLCQKTTILQKSESHWRHCVLLVLYFVYSNIVITSSIRCQWRSSFCLAEICILFRFTLKRHHWIDDRITKLIYVCIFNYRLYLRQQLQTSTGIACSLRGSFKLIWCTRVSDNSSSFNKALSLGRSVAFKLMWSI